MHGFHVGFIDWKTVFKRDTEKEGCQKYIMQLHVQVYGHDKAMVNKMKYYFSTKSPSPLLIHSSTLWKQAYAWLISWIYLQETIINHDSCAETGAADKIAVTL